MLVKLILRGGAADKINAMVGLESRKKELERDLAQAQEPLPCFIPTWCIISGLNSTIFIVRWSMMTRTSGSRTRAFLCPKWAN